MIFFNNKVYACFKNFMTQKSFCSEKIDIAFSVVILTRIHCVILIEAIHTQA